MAESNGSPGVTGQPPATVDQHRAMAGRIEALKRSVAGLQQPTSLDFKEKLTIALQELQDTLEEMELTEEELQSQHEELATAHQTIEVQRRRYRDLFDFAPHPYLVTDAKGIVQQANRAAAALFNFPQDFLEGKPLVILVAKKEHESFRKRLDQLVYARPPISAQGGVQEWQAVMQRHQGKPFSAAISVAALYDSRPESTGLLWLVRDITELKQAEQAIQKSANEAQLLARANSVMAEVGRIISSAQDVNQVYDRFAEQVRQLIPFDRIALSTIDLDGGTFTDLYIKGLDVPERRPGTGGPLAGTITGEAVRTRAPLLIQGETEEGFRQRFPSSLVLFKAGLRSFLSVPLVSQGRVIGMLHLPSAGANAYTETHVVLAQNVADQIAGAIANAWLYAERAQLGQLAQELSTPVLPIREQLLLLPLIGAIDSQRAARLTDRLLNAIRASRARVVVIDVTGVAFMDSYVANHLIKTAEAARLLGTAIIVTGVSADVANTLVRLGVDLRKIETVGDLQSGIEKADQLLGYTRLAPRSDSSRAASTESGRSATTTSRGTKSDQPKSGSRSDRASPSVVGPTRRLTSADSPAGRERPLRAGFKPAPTPIRG